MKKDIKVYAFVGPSGTGKSYRAQMVAGEYDIKYGPAFKHSVRIGGNLFRLAGTKKKN